MRNLSDTAAEVRNLVKLLTDSGIAVAYNPCIERRRSGTVYLTWPGEPPVVGNSGFCTLEHYRQCLRAGTFTVVLFDGALLQMWFAFQRGELRKQSLCYHPCPIELGTGQLEQGNPLGDLQDRISGPDLDLRLRSPMRFDYDQDSAGPGHSASHVHLISASCRCPVVARISIGHFVRFVFSHFYPTEWETHPFLRTWRQHDADRTIRPEEEQVLHFACRRPTQT